MSDSNPIPDDAADEHDIPRGRSPVERAIVWTLIGGLIVVLGIEAASQNGYTSTLAALQEKFSNTEELSRLSDARTEISGWPSETKTDGAKVGDTVANRIITFRWFSLFKNYEIQLRVDAGDDDPVIMNLTTADAEELDAVGAANEGGDEQLPGDGGGFGGRAPSVAMPGGGRPGGGGPGGGQRGGRSRPGPGLLGELEHEWVQAELGMTEEQLAKLPEITASVRPDFSALRDVPEDERRAAFQEMRANIETKGEAAAKELLDDEQFGRARELLFQRMGAEALAREDVATELELDDSQKKQVAELMTELNGSVAALGFRATPVARDEAKGPWKALLLDVLSDEQTGKWEALLGAPPEKGPEPEPAARPQRPATE